MKCLTFQFRLWQFIVVILACGAIAGVFANKHRKRILETQAIKRLESLGALVYVDDGDGSGSSRFGSAAGDKQYYVVALGGASDRIQDDDLSVLPRIQNISRLDLSYCQRLTAKGLQHLLPCQTVRHLDLSGTTFSDEGLRYVSKLQFLETLRIADKNVSEHGLATLAGLSRLTELDFHFGAVERIHIASGFESLKMFNLHDCSKLENVRLSGLVKLRDLSISGESLKTVVLTDMPRLARVKIFGRSLETVEIRRSPSMVVLSYDGQHSGTKLLIDKNSMIEELEMGLGIHCEDLAQLRTTPQLRRLTVAGVAGRQCRDIGFLKDLKELQVLSWPNAGFIDSDLALFTGCRRLRILELQDSGIVGHGLEFLANCRCLERLDLRGNPLSPEGIAKLSTMNSLKYLDIGGTEIDDADFENLKKMTFLQELRLGFGVFASGVQELRRCLKGTTIVAN